MQALRWMSATGDPAPTTITSNPSAGDGTRSVAGVQTRTGLLGSRAVRPHPFVGVGHPAEVRP
jgi:hypothetical protein